MVRDGYTSGAHIDPLRTVVSRVYGVLTRHSAVNYHAKQRFDRAKHLRISGTDRHTLAAAYLFLSQCQGRAGDELDRDVLPTAQVHRGLDQLLGPVVEPPHVRGARNRQAACVDVWAST